MNPALRLSAAAILLREQPVRRVFLARRSDALRFFGGTFAFCGGTVSRLDRQTLGEDEDRLLRWTLARELLEETGFLLDDSNRDAPSRAELRRRVLADPRVWTREIDPDSTALSKPRRALQLITPDHYPVRFDTWFFLLDVDRVVSGQEAEIWPGELTEGRWDTPAAWLDAWRRGELHLSPPVLHLLRLLEVPGPGDLGVHLRQAHAVAMADPPLNLRQDPGVRVLPLRTPTLPPARHTNTYVIGRAPAYIVDPATPHAAERETLEAALRQETREGSSLEAILLTHHHPDHVGAVEFLRQRWNLPVWAHARTAELLEGRVGVDRHLLPGDRLSLGTSPDGREGWTLECLFTPGHAEGHLCFLDSLYGSLVCGDMMSTLSSILVHPDDGDMAEYMRSLESLCDRGVRVVHPSHGPSDARGERAILEQIEHRRRREESVLGAVEDGASHLDDIVEKVYWDVPRPMRGYAAHSVRSILRKLKTEGQVVDTDGGFRIA